MKYNVFLKLYKFRKVLPRMREWIEIASFLPYPLSKVVLPRMREWIEISVRLSRLNVLSVLPRMREWIEILKLYRLAV